MDPTRFPAPLRSAIAELADLPAYTWPPRRITADEAIEYINDDVLTAYFAVRRADACDGIAWEFIYEALTEEQQAQLHTAIVHSHPAAVRLLRDATVLHVADWLARQATDRRALARGAA